MVIHTSTMSSNNHSLFILGQINLNLELRPSASNLMENVFKYKKISHISTTKIGIVFKVPDRVGLFLYKSNMQMQ